MNHRVVVVGGLAVFVVAVSSVCSATTQGQGAAGAPALRALILARVGSLAKLQVPARNEDLPQPRRADGSLDPRYQITEAKRYLGKLLFSDPVRSNNIHSEFGGVMSTSQTASCASCHLGAAASKAGQVFNFGVGGEGYAYTAPDGHLVIRRRVQAGLVDLIPTALEKTDAAGQVVESGRFDAVDSVPRLSPTVIGFAYNNRLLLGGNAGEPYDPSNPRKANKNPLNLPAGENLAEVAFMSHRMADTQQKALQAIPVYVKLFERASPEEAAQAHASGSLDDLINDHTTARAIAAFCRTVITRNTPWDRFLAGDDSALTPQQIEGARLYFTAATVGGAGCISCHSGPALNKVLGDEAGTGVESNFHNMGIGDHPLQELARKALGDPNRHDVGRAEATGDPADNFKFKTPSLRQLEDGGQYTHSGQFDSIRAVVEYLNAGIPSDPNAAAAGNLDPLFTNPRGPDHPGLGLAPDQIAALVDFLENGLYDPGFVTLDPSSPTDTFDPNARDLTYDSELHALGAVDGLLPSRMNIGSNDSLSRRDRGVEFVEATDSLTMGWDSFSFDRFARKLVEQFTLTNQSRKPVDGDLILVFTELPPGLVMTNASGYVAHTAGMIGRPYVRLRLDGGALAPGASTPVELDLKIYRGFGSGNYVCRTLCGSGSP